MKTSADPDSMNCQAPNSEPSTSPPPDSQPPTLNHQPPQKTRRRRGKVARLPRAVREQLNLMLADGVPHEEIISRLGDHGKHLNRQNIINWQNGGYKEWLKDEPWLDQLHASLDFASNVLDDSDNPKIREASLVIAVKQLYELIKSFEPAEFQDQLSSEPGLYCRILNSLAKLAEIGLRYDKEHADSVRQQRREVNRSKKAAGLTDDMLRNYENEFKLLRRPPQKAPAPPPAPPAPAPAASEPQAVSLSNAT